MVQKWPGERIQERIRLVLRLLSEILATLGWRLKILCGPPRLRRKL